MWDVGINGVNRQNKIIRLGIQNGSQEPGFPRAFLNGQFRLRRAKSGKKQLSTVLPTKFEDNH